jgi:hypothetical protein
MCHWLHTNAQPWHTNTQTLIIKINACMRIPQALKQAYSQGYPESAMHVQESIGSRNSAIHNDYHTSLRPSSMLEPRYPSLKVVMCKNTHEVESCDKIGKDNGVKTQWQQEQARDAAAKLLVPSLPCHPRAPR